MQIGKFQNLKILRALSHGLYLGESEAETVLLPLKYCPENFEIGEYLEVFVYLDSEDRPVATTLEPYGIVGDFCYLEVIDATRNGAFLDWGLEKDLLLPFRNQLHRLYQGDMVVVYIYEDEVSGRIVATQKFKPWFNYDFIDLQEGDEVEGMVYEISATTVRLVTSEGQSARLARNRAPDLQVGDIFKAKIAVIRDNYLELKAGPSTLDVVAEDAAKFMDILGANRGFLPLHDKSDPRLIEKELGWSKKHFKKVVGYLLKRNAITLQAEGISLTKLR